jgi:energy-coupling factor transporter ATP-binding protein EcfA2
MKKLPITLLCGNAGSGKSTLANLIVKHHDYTIDLALADPIKRAIEELFNVNSRYLWGESYLRNSIIANPFKYGLAEFNYFKAMVVRYCEQEEIVHPRSGDSTYRYVWDAGDWCNSLRLYFTERPDKDLTVRHLLQSFGTDFVRNHIDHNFWIKQGIATATSLLEGGYNYHPEKGLIHCPTSYYNSVVISDGRFRSEVLYNMKNNGSNVLVGRDTPKSSTHQSETELSTIPEYWFDRIVDNNKGLDHLEGAAQLFHLLLT